MDTRREVWVYDPALDYRGNRYACGKPPNACQINPCTTSFEHYLHLNGYRKVSDDVVNSVSGPSLLGTDVLVLYGEDVLTEVS